MILKLTAIFHRYITAIFLNIVDIDNKLISKKISFREENYKYFLGYIDADYKIKPFSIILPNTSAYIKSYDTKTKWMSFFIKDEESSKICDNIWNKVSNSMKNKSDSKPLYNKEFLKAKIKSYGDEATDFHNKEMSRLGSCYTCLAVIFIDFVFKKDENYYPQVFLK